MGVCSSKHTQIDCGWWFGTFFIFHNTWDNPSHWLIFFRGLKPPTCCSGSDCTVLVLKILKYKHLSSKIVRRQIVLTISYAGQCGKASNLRWFGNCLRFFGLPPNPKTGEGLFGCMGSWLHPLIHWLIRGGVPYGSLPCEETSIWKTYHEQLRYVKSPFEPSKYLCWWLHMSYTDIYSVGTSNI